jgi:hypothetical protein
MQRRYGGIGRVRFCRTGLYSAAQRSLAASRSRPSMKMKEGRLGHPVTIPRAKI